MGFWTRKRCGVLLTEPNYFFFSDDESDDGDYDDDDDTHIYIHKRGEAWKKREARWERGRGRGFAAPRLVWIHSTVQRT